MSEIVKTESVVLSKLNYGDTSSIAALYSKEFGRISAIFKGGRSSKSKMGLAVDPLNYLQIVLYTKDSRDVQVISSVDLIEHYPRIKEDFEKLKYSHAILELFKKLLPEHETNKKLFKGLIRILMLINESNEEPKILFSKFFLFFLTELGYELQLDSCTVCGKSLMINNGLSYNYEIGILCNDCKSGYSESFYFSAELLNYLICLKTNKNPLNISEEIKDKTIIFLEKYLKYHVSDFKGIQAFQLFKSEIK